MKNQECSVSNEHFKQTTLGASMISQWWPDQLNLKILQQNSQSLKPEDENFSYRKSFASLNLEAIKKDLHQLMTDSKEWWPADYGHYGPFFIRMAWHSAGTYRAMDGRGGAFGGNQRFAPINSWPDNVNLDKARRLLWPVKKKYGNKISWADLMILTSNVAMESMGFSTIGFAGGREDIWEPEEDINWGPELEWLGDERHKEGRKLENPLAAVQMGLIYVNPEGPNGEPNVLEAAKDVRESFERMAMNDEETVALIAGGHTFGKCHGAADPSKYVGSEPEAAAIEEQGLGWKNSFGKGKSADTIGSGLEGAWTPTPIKWDNSFLETLFKYDWNLEKSPAGAWQWVPTDPKSKELVPDAHIPNKTHKPIMLTTDLALRMDPDYEPVSRRFLENPQEFQKAFAKAWFKLTHRDMGPKSRYFGKDVPKEEFIWQDLIPAVDHELIDESDIEFLKNKILNSSLTISELVYTAWSSASTYRDSDKRGGANGARIALLPQKEWEINEPEQLKKVLEVLKEIQIEFNEAQKNNKEVSLADLIVLGGTVAVEKAAKKGGFNIKVPFKAGRTDALQEQTDEASFKHMEPVADAFRNDLKESCKELITERVLIDKAQLLKLSVHEMTVLIGGMRVLGANFGKSEYGLFTDRIGVLSNDFFVNLLDMDIEWKSVENDLQRFEGYDRNNGKLKYKATRVDLIFGSNSQLRAQAEFYAQDDNKEKFAGDFIKAWCKVMELDRFDL